MNIPNNRIRHITETNMRSSNSDVDQPHNTPRRCRGDHTHLVTPGWLFRYLSRRFCVTGEPVSWQRTAHWSCGRTRTECVKTCEIPRGNLCRSEKYNIKLSPSDVPWIRNFRQYHQNIIFFINKNIFFNDNYFDFR